MDQKKKNIMIWGASFLVTEGIISLLRNQGNLFVAGLAGSRENLITFVKKETSDVLIIDASAPEFDTAVIEEVKNITNPPVILLLLDTVTRSQFHRYLEAGIKNLLLKDASAGEIMNAVESAINKRKYYSSEILEIILDSLEPNIHFDTVNRLTPSEKEIVRLIAGGLTTKQIAARRNISFHTVNTHRKNIFRKLEVSNVSELTMKAIKAGWIDNIEYYI